MVPKYPPCLVFRAGSRQDAYVLWVLLFPLRRPGRVLHLVWALHTPGCFLQRFHPQSLVGGGVVFFGVVGCAVWWGVAWTRGDVIQAYAGGRDAADSCFVVSLCGVDCGGAVFWYASKLVVVCAVFV